MQFHTYKLMTNATPLCHGALVLRMAGIVPRRASDALVACAQPGPRSGVGIPGFLLPVAEGVLEGGGARSWHHSSSGAHTGGGGSRCLLHTLICIYLSQF